MEGLPGGTGLRALVRSQRKEPAQEPAQLQRTSIKNAQRTPGITHQHFTFIKTVSSYPLGYCIENLVV